MGWVAIVNPASGMPGAALRCGEALKQAGYVDKILVGGGPGDSTQLARKSWRAKGIAVVGGDGTVLEVIAGLAKKPRPIAVFPVGHGNCLARHLGATTVEKAQTILRNGSPQSIDLMDICLTKRNGDVQKLRAISTLSLGYVSNVVGLGRNRLAFLGRAAYGVASALTYPHRQVLHLEIDGVRSLRALRTGVVVNNAAYLANFRALAQARLADGLLDVMDMDYGWKMQMAHNASVLLGSSLVGPAQLAKATSVRISPARAQAVMVDGEIIHDVIDVHVTCMPLAQECISLLPHG